MKSLLFFVLLIAVLAQFIEAKMESEIDFLSRTTQKSFFDKLMAGRNRSWKELKSDPEYSVDAPMPNPGLARICGKRLGIHVRKVCREPALMPPPDIEIMCCFRGCGEELIITRMCPEKRDM